MNHVALLNPHKVVFGDGCVYQFIHDFVQTGLRRLFVLTIPVLEDKVKTLLRELTQNDVAVIINTDIIEEPSFDDFKKLINTLREFEADAVLGIGGGSVMDTAKLLAAMANNNQSVEDVIGIGKLSERKLYLACIPTTAGTGSEVSPNAIFLDNQQGGKKGVISPFLVPDAAYVDPELSYGVPAAITAATGVDAFTHCLEAYVNVFSNPMVDLFAKKGMQLIASSLVTAVNEPENRQARSDVALGSLYGGMCLGPVNTAAIHALSYPLGSNFKVPHGLSNAVLMPYVVEYNLSAAVSRYAEVAHYLGVESSGNEQLDAESLVDAIKKWLQRLGLPLKIAALGIEASVLPQMAKDAMQVQRLLKNNVREVDYESALEIYKKAY